MSATLDFKERSIKWAVKDSGVNREVIIPINSLLLGIILDTKKTYNKVKDFSKIRITSILFDVKGLDIKVRPTEKLAYQFNYEDVRTLELCFSVNKFNLIFYTDAHETVTTLDYLEVCKELTIAFKLLNKEQDKQLNLF